MITLNPNECRILGTLIEKAQTTPGQYPLSLNGLTVGCNQKNNRDPVSNLSEEQVFDALDSLRTKGFVREAMLSGSRVSKFRHITREVLSVNTEELVLLAELWLRGPQSAGELRANANRMVPLESAEAVVALLDGLAKRPEPYVRELPRRPGERATRFMQLFCPTLHPLDGPIGAYSSAPQSTSPPGAIAHSPMLAEPTMRLDHAELARRVSQLENELSDLKNTVERLAAAVGGI